MPGGIPIEDLMRCAVQVIGRIAIPLDKAREIVTTGKRQVRAFNLFDGTLKMNEVARKAKLDQGNLSRAASRWVKEGVAFWVGQGKEARLLHIYPIAEVKTRKAAKKGTRGTRE